MNKHFPIVVIILISCLFVSLLYINSFTGFAPGDPTPTVNIEESTPKLPKSSSCIDINANEKCGQSCWLNADGNPPGTFESSSGKIGITSWDGNCRDIFTYQDSSQPMCCGECDCPLNSICNQGKCIPIEPGFGVLNIPLDSFSGNTNSKCAILIYNNNIHNGNNIVARYEGNQLTGSSLSNQIRSGDYRISLYKIKADGNLGSEFYQDIKLEAGKTVVAEKFNNGIYTSFC
ncbi:MAG: hypothetical protein HY831_03480 [Candidatus Aenigmarchaeota archaeon]|nr:hypothetical protein [Candidatus Aenigmarchaeota archaeon]